MTNPPNPPPPATLQQQCYVTALALMAKVGSGALAHAEPADAAVFLRMLQDAHRFLDAGQAQDPPAAKSTTHEGKHHGNDSSV